MFGRIHSRAALACATSALIALSASGAAAQGPPPPPPPAQAELALMLFDMSGSMNGPTPGGDVKHDVAVALANAFLDEVKPNREYALWLFSGNTATPVVTFEQHATPDQVRAVINTLPMPGGGTPFAQEFCNAVDHLIQTQITRDANLPPGVPPILYEKRIAIYTDGIENTTPNADQCYGHTSTSPSPATDVGSWQWKIVNKASTGVAASPPAPGLPVTVIVDVDMIFDQFIPSALRRFSSAPSRAGSAALLDPAFVQGIAIKPIASAPQVKPVSQVTPGLVGDVGALAAQIGTVTVLPGVPLLSENELALRAYTSVSFFTGGQFQPVLNLADVPLAGDSDGDRCVDMGDYDAVMAKYGQNVGYDDPADLNRDRAVDYSDYLTLLSNWGTGC